VFWVCFIALSVVEGVVLLLMAISAFRSYKAGNTSELSNVIHRDGILFYVYLLALSVTSAITIRLANYDMLILPQTVLYSILTTRIILNIRVISQKTHEQGTGLHITHPMEFGARATQLDNSRWILETRETGSEDPVGGV